ncbi:MAG: phosphoribosylanthranilate isomerase [Oscillospiraceae bacterium]|nr:phosphoribosylanthranilate isomerase [Oscillospiraceae bacterium]
MKIKICGLFNPADIEAVNEALPDYIGFVFTESRRQISFEIAREFKKHLDKRINATGVFVNAQISDIARLYEQNIINTAQLHGAETESYIAELKNACKIPVIKAGNFNNKFPENADYLLFDNGIGGTGKAFDWGLIPKVDNPFFLAGGINLNNIAEAMKQGAYCIDLSGGAEDSATGMKNREKIIRLVKTVREFKE